MFTYLRRLYSYIYLYIFYLLSSWFSVITSYTYLSIFYSFLLFDYYMVYMHICIYRSTDTRAIASRITASAARGISPASRATNARGCSACAYTTPLRLLSKASTTGEREREMGFRWFGGMFFVSTYLVL